MTDEQRYPDHYDWPDTPATDAEEAQAEGWLKNNADDMHIAEWIVLTEEGDTPAFPDQQQAERYAAEHGGVAVGVADNVIINEADADEEQAADEAAAWADSPDNPANYQAGGGCEMYQETQQQEDTVVSGPLPEDRTTVAGSTSSFNTTDQDRALMWDGPAERAPNADQATINAYIERAEADYWREDGYGSNGKGADYTYVELPDAKDHGYRQYDGNGHG